jgi:4,5-dihydroxyphthalate decarboxylase
MYLRGRAGRGRGVHGAQRLAHRDDRAGQAPRRDAGGRRNPRHAIDIPPLFREGDKRIVRLFANYKDIEIEFFKKTAIFPIMHVTVIRQEIAEKYPWVPINLVKAFDQAKALAYRRIANPRMVPLAWIRTAWEEQQDILGSDPWAYGLTDTNRKNLQTVQRYCYQQGLISRVMPLDELFDDTDLGDAAGGAENI